MSPLRLWQPEPLPLALGVEDVVLVAVQRVPAVSPEANLLYEVSQIKYILTKLKY